MDDEKMSEADAHFCAGLLAACLESDYLGKTAKDMIRKVVKHLVEYKK